MNIFVGNLSFGVSEQELKGLFSNHGEVVSVKIVTDRETGRSRGFGFVEMATRDAGQSAIDALNGFALQGRNMSVNEARDREERPRLRSNDRPSRPYGGGGGRR